MTATILVAIGSNRRHGRHGAPTGVVAAAIAVLAAEFTIIARSTIRTTAPMGPSNRAFANAVVAVETPLGLFETLARLKAIEVRFGRRPGRRWGARVLDLDIVAAEIAVLPSRLGWRRAASRLVVPHHGLAERSFVLDPLVEIAPEWRHPVLHLSTRQLRARLHRRRSLARAPSP